MANFKKLANTDDKLLNENFIKLFDKEWNKVTKSLVRTTPEGQIRFTLINYKKFEKKIKFLAKLHFPKKFAFTDIFLSLREKRSISENSFSTPYFLFFPPYTYEDELLEELNRPYNPLMDRGLLFFYANNIESNPNYAKDLITYWFESYVLSASKKEFNSQKNESLTTKKYKTCYSYSPIKEALEHFNCVLTDEEYKTIFTELCSKHGVILEEVSYETFGLHYKNPTR